MTDSLLIVFAKAPDPGKVKTRLAVDIGDGMAARIYRALAETAWAACRQAQGALPCALWLYVDPPGREGELAAWLPGADACVPQPEGDLGARIVAAFRLGFEAGFTRVAIIGTDVPRLSADLILRALATCESDNVAVGPVRFINS